MTRPARSAVVLAALIVGLVLAGASPAAAHAVLRQADPGPGSALAGAPSAVTLTFDEGVQYAATSVQVTDLRGHRVDDGVVSHPGGSPERITTRFSRTLPTGTYRVRWHVVSEDSHPVSGAFDFGVGTVPVAIGEAPPGGSRLVGDLMGAVRLVSELGLVLLVGCTLILLTLWPAGLERTGPARLAWAGEGLSVLAAAAGFVLQGPYGAGTGLSTAADPALLRLTLDGRFGHLMLLRLGVLVLVGVVLARLRRRERADRLDLGVLGLVLVATWGLAGHAASGRLPAVTVAADALHVAAAAAWLGGLLLLVVWGDRDPALRAALPAFSRLAVVCVAVLLVTGTVQAARQVSLSASGPDGGLPGQLVHTRYGVLLLAKVGGWALLVGLGWFARRRVAVGRFPVTAVLIETVVALGVLALGSQLIATVPARTAARSPVTAPGAALEFPLRARGASILPGTGAPGRWLPRPGEVPRPPGPPEVATGAGPLTG